MNELIEWREYNSPFCAAGRVADRCVLNVKPSTRFENDVFCISMFGLVVVSDFEGNVDEAKAKAESLYRNHLITAIKAADDDLLKEAGVQRVKKPDGQFQCMNCEEGIWDFYGPPPEKCDCGADVVILQPETSEPCIH
jgi:hypothetical protein